MLIEILKENNIKHSIVNNKIVITQNLRSYDDNLLIYLKDCIIDGHIDLEFLDTIPEGCLNNCFIRNYLDLSRLKCLPNNTLNNCNINTNLFLNRAVSIPETALNNTIIGGSLSLSSLEYLPKGFNISVGYSIHLDSLKSKTLKNLLLNPGQKRQLGFNLLK